VAPGNYQDIKTWLRRLYADDPRPWLVGFSGGKDSTRVASLVFGFVPYGPLERRPQAHWGAFGKPGLPQHNPPQRPARPGAAGDGL